MQHTSERLAIYQEMPADFLTPALAFQALYEEGKGACLLESSEGTGQDFSFIGVRPFEIFSSSSREAFSELRNMLQAYSCQNLPPHLPLAGGAVGFMAYDSIRLLEEIPDHLPDLHQLPHLLFHFYSEFLIFDHAKKKVLFAVNVETEEEGETLLKDLIRRAHAHREQPPISQGRTEETVDVTDEEFQEMVGKTKEYLQKGDVFQVVISRTFCKKITVSPFQIYLSLRRTSPSPYLFFFDAKDFCLVGASPEQLVSIKGDTVYTTPIAGTRKRGKTKEEDSALEKELLQDVKENAEHVMLVDLARNDIGKVSRPASVQVKSFKQIEKFSHVMHIVSQVEGTKRQDLDAVDVLQALFPAGTVSGAPKIRAMEIIDEIEKTKRGIYGGAIVALDGRGGLVSCLAIRMAFLKNQIAYIRAGAGVVYDSDPAKEAEETKLKAKSVLEAVRAAQGEI